MSGCSDEEDVSDGYRHDGDGGSDGDDDDDSEIGKSERRRRRMPFGKAVMHRFTKAKTKLRRVRSRKALLPKSCLGNQGSVIVEGGRRRSGCRFCFSRPRVLESSDESPISDPNNPKFTHAMLVNLIEKNDFYCRECNPHLD